MAWYSSGSIVKSVWPSLTKSPSLNSMDLKVSEHACVDIDGFRRLGSAGVLIVVGRLLLDHGSRGDFRHGLLRNCWTCFFASGYR